MVIIAYLSPTLVRAREELPFAAISHADPFPVAVLGIYFFTMLGFIACIYVFSRRRGVMAVTGIAFYEVIHVLTNSIFMGEIYLIVHAHGFTTSGWEGLGHGL